MKTFQAFINLLIASLLLLFVLVSCSDDQKKDYVFKIGVSQCSGGDWREKMNDEIRREAIFHPGLTFEFCNAFDSFEKQSRDVDSLISIGVDLLVIAPIDTEHGEEMVAKAMSKKIPVIVADRRLTSKNYTAYVGGDNYAAGYNAAEYLVSRLPQGGQILEITGHEGSSPVAMRHNGFMDVIGKHPEFEVVASIDGYWLRDSAKVIMEDAIHKFPNIKAVFCHNDYMAMGSIEMYRWVRKFQKEYGDEVPSWTPVFIGMDAVYGSNHGLEWIARGDMDASVLYPTGGDVIVQTAVKILTGLPYDKDCVLNTFVVDVKGAALLNDMDQAINHEVGQVHWLQKRENELLKRINVEQVLLLVSGAFILFIIIAVIRMRRHHIERRKTALRLVRINRQLRDAAHIRLENMKSASDADNFERTVMQKETMEDRVPKTAEMSALPMVDPFIERVYALIDEQYAKPSFGVEQLSVLLDMSRSQLYRKVRSLTGVTPFDMIRDKRMIEAERLLSEGMEIEKVALNVGFSTVTYFIKCYDEYKRISEKQA